jgi:hypothetical protein
MPYSKFEELLSKRPNFLLKKKFEKYMNQAVMEEKAVPLDYKMNVPTHIEENALKDKFTFAVKDGKLDYSRLNDNEIKHHLAKYRHFLTLENKFKNVVLRKLTEIRVEKSKPSFKSMIQTYLIKQREKDERARQRVKEQVLGIYEKKTFD